ncbi:biotin/lipoyl-containing protein, partial [Amycolatopsis samaneae]|uniref:biotin/lipoyl-containing protein n=1 Tax=Amycolatopsis samaneae TaxID=664691 RepID=UPI0031EE341F
MAYTVTLPELGESVTEGTVTRWLKQEGDTVAVDEPLLEISTDKVDTEVPSPVAGTVVKISAAEDETVEVGGELAVIDDGTGGVPASSAPAAAPAAQPEPEPAQQATPAETPAPAAAPAPSGPAQGTEVKLPELGESVTEGTVTRWLKQVGDTVAVDEPLLEISTDKVDTEVPSPVAGTVLEIRAGEDETVEVGGVPAVIGDANAAPAPTAAQMNPPAPAAPAEPAPTPTP